MSELFGILVEARDRLKAWPGAFDRLAKRRRRRQRNRRIAAAALALALAAVAVGLAVNVFGGLGKNERHLPASPVITPSNVGLLRVAWKARTGGIAQSSPIVAAGLVLVGSTRGSLYAFDGHSGSVAWRGVTHGSIESTPAVARGAAYVSSNDGHLYAFPLSCRRAGGACSPQWSAAIHGRHPGGATAGGGDVYVDSDDGNFYAFGAECGTGGATCSPLWVAHTGGRAAMMRREGRALTDHPFLADVLVSPAVAGSLVWDTSGGLLEAFSTNCGTRGSACTPAVTIPPPDGSAFVSSPAVAGGIVYATSAVGSLYAFPESCAARRGPCRALWAGAAGDLPTPPAVADGVVYESGSAFLVSCATGGARCAPLWVSGGGLPGATTVRGGLVYVSSGTGGELDAYRARCSSTSGSCTPLFTRGFPNVVNTPSVWGGRVLFETCADGTVYAFTVRGSPA